MTESYRLRQAIFNRDGENRPQFHQAVDHEKLHQGIAVAGGQVTRRRVESKPCYLAWICKLHTGHFLEVSFRVLGLSPAHKVSVLCPIEEHFFRFILAADPNQARRGAPCTDASWSIYRIHLLQVPQLDTIDGCSIARRQSVHSKYPARTHRRSPGLTRRPLWPNIKLRHCVPSMRLRMHIAPSMRWRFFCRS